MTRKLKTTGFAFTGFVVYSALRMMTPYLFRNYVTANLASCILFMIIGGTYSTVVLGSRAPFAETSKKVLLKSFAVVLIYCFVSMCTSTLILNCLNDVNYFEQSAAYADLSKADMTLSMIISLTAAPICEELVFRGCMYRFLSTLNKKAAMIISSFIFAAWHGTIVHMYAAFFGGLLFCIIYNKTGKLRYTMLAHMIFNAVTAFISCFRYPVFMTSPWWVLSLNCLLLFTFMFLCDEPDAESGVKSRELTDEEKRNREKTRQIVDEVLDEYKNKH